MEKVEYLFPHPNFIFCEEIIDFDNSIVSLISIVNKKSMLNTLIKYENAFKEVLGIDFSPSHFIAEIEKEKKIRPLINNDEALLGILLGFGEDSSRAFKEKDQNFDDNLYQCIEVQWPKKCRIFPVGFMGNPESEEVKQLVNAYSSELKNIWALYRGKNPLKLTLQKLCECQ